MERKEYSEATVAILDMVATERGRQEFLKSQGKFTYTCADKEMTHAEACTVLMEEAGEVAHEVNEGIGSDRNIDKRRLMKELIEVAAVAVSWAEKVHTEIESDNPEISKPVDHSSDTVFSARNGTLDPRQTLIYNYFLGLTKDPPKEMFSDVQLVALNKAAMPTHFQLITIENTLLLNYVDAIDIVNKAAEHITKNFTPLFQYMVHANRASGAVFVKEKEFFISQGGDKESWGKEWTEVSATSIEHAREIGCELFPWAKHYSAQAKP
jgi:NTP pyrophosphatase (non-canonical NTP hydrolase)